jgi:hypothetical protein
MSPLLLLLLLAASSLTVDSQSTSNCSYPTSLVPCTQVLYSQFSTSASSSNGSYGGLNSPVCTPPVFAFTSSISIALDGSNPAYNVNNSLTVALNDNSNPTGPAFFTATNVTYTPPTTVGTTFTLAPTANTSFLLKQGCVGTGTCATLVNVIWGCRAPAQPTSSSSSTASVSPSSPAASSTGNGATQSHVPGLVMIVGVSVLALLAILQL